MKTKLLHKRWTEKKIMQAKNVPPHPLLFLKLHNAAYQASHHFATLYNDTTLYNKQHITTVEQSESTNITSHNATQHSTVSQLFFSVCLFVLSFQESPTGLPSTQPQPTAGFCQRQNGTIRENC